MHEETLERQVFRRIQLDIEFEFPWERHVMLGDDLPKDEYRYFMEPFEQHDLFSRLHCRLLCSV